MPSRSVAASPLLVVGAVLALAAVAHARDEAKADCKRGCEEALQSCKSDCRYERDSGTRQQSYLYTSCDSDCHDTYDSCKSDCESQ